MQKLILFILLIQINWIQLSAQPSSDTSKCYGVTTLRKIALKLIQGQQCDTLLKISERQIQNRDSVISIKDKEITGYKTESSLKESIISVKEQEKQTINLQLKHTKRQLALTRVEYLLTTLLLLTSTGYFIIH